MPSAKSLYMENIRSLHAPIFVTNSPTFIPCTERLALIYSPFKNHMIHTLHPQLVPIE